MCKEERSLLLYRVILVTLSISGIFAISLPSPQWLDELVGSLFIKILFFIILSYSIIMSLFSNTYTIFFCAVYGMAGLLCSLSVYPHSEIPFRTVCLSLFLLIIGHILAWRPQINSHQILIYPPFSIGPIRTI